MIDTKALRSRILDLAIQGKLTEQLPSDSTAEELYQQIQAEKLALIKEGKIKKEKPLPEISADEIPFEIPSNWKWVQLGELGEGINNAFADGPFGSNLKREHYTFEKQVRIIQLSNIGDEGWRNENEKYTTFEHLKTIERSEVFAGNIVIAKMMPAGRAIIVPDTGTKYVLSSDCIKFVPNHTLYAKYICYAINSDSFRKQVSGNIHGIGRERTSLSLIKKYVLPVPPLAEQKRIVERVEEIFRLLDTIDQAQEKYSADSQILKAKLITAGIQGKLTKQLESDGTAHELYQQIQAEKQKLIKEGKLKKEKPLPPISPDEIPFEIPQNWMWVRINDIFAVGTGSTPSKNEKKYYNGGDIPWVNSALTVNRYIEKVNTYITEYALNSLNLKLYAEHTLIIAMYGEGKTRGQISELLIPATTNQACAALSSIIYHQETINYVFYFFQNYYDSLRALAHGGNQPNLNLQKIKDVLIPLPPLAEQKRIADVLERALGVFE